MKITIALIVIVIGGFFLPNDMDLNVHTEFLKIPGKPGVTQIWYNHRGICGEYQTPDQINRCWKKIGLIK